MQGSPLLQRTCLLPCFRPCRLTASAGLCCGQVPMWLALQLKHRQLCDIKLPEWLRDQDLNNLHQAEDASRKRNQLEQVDFHYQETAALLFRHSPDSFYGTSPRPLPSICNNTVGNRPTPFGGGLRSVPLCWHTWIPLLQHGLQSPPVLAYFPRMVLVVCPSGSVWTRA